MRVVPDISMPGDPNTGFRVGETQQFSNGTYYAEYRIGGTSLASPMFAGMTALALQRSGTGGGLLNPAIYANKAAFRDVDGPLQDVGTVRVDFANTVDDSKGYIYSVRLFDQDSSLAVGPGWDDVTGVGSPTVKWLSVLR